MNSIYFNFFTKYGIPLLFIVISLVTFIKYKKHLSSKVLSIFFFLFGISLLIYISTQQPNLSSIIKYYKETLNLNLANVNSITVTKYNIERVITNDEKIEQLLTAFKYNKEIIFRNEDWSSTSKYELKLSTKDNREYKYVVYETEKKVSIIYLKMFHKNKYTFIAEFDNFYIKDVGLNLN